MCCFSRPVSSVNATNIFARSGNEGRQFLAYSMTIVAKEELAMILPIPVAKLAREDAVRFINLEQYLTFFDNLWRGFNPNRSRGRSTKAAGSPLKVVEVGDFEASFVPRIRDFGRLDARFRLPTEVWSQLPHYRDYGFVVFKLRKLQAGTQRRFHPMAFDFPRADPQRLFFPTVHIHDGKVHATARFDHELYCQRSGGERLGPVWQESAQPAGLFTQVGKAKGLLDPEEHVHQRILRGVLRNQDTWV